MAQTVKNLPATWETWVRSLGWEDLLEKGTAVALVFLPGEFHGQRSLAACSPWGRKELDMTERLSLSFTFVNNCFEDNKRQCLMLIFISLIRWFHLILFSIFSFPVSSSLTFSLCPKCTPSLSMGRERRKYALKKAQVE